jgi:hypothetical protein
MPRQKRQSFVDIFLNIHRFSPSMISSVSLMLADFMLHQSGVWVRRGIRLRLRLQMVLDLRVQGMQVARRDPSSST